MERKTAPGGERGVKGLRRDELHVGALTGEPGGERDRRLDVPARPRGEDADSQVRPRLQRTLDGARAGRNSPNKSVGQGSLCGLRAVRPAMLRWTSEQGEGEADVLAPPSAVAALAAGCRPVWAS